jgi:hypothetical protein
MQYIFIPGRESIFIPIIGSTPDEEIKIIEKYFDISGQLLVSMKKNNIQKRKNYEIQGCID